MLGFNLLIFPLSVGPASKIYKNSRLGLCVTVWPSRSERLCGSCPHAVLHWSGCRYGFLQTCAWPLKVTVLGAGLLEDASSYEWCSTLWRHLERSLAPLPPEDTVSALEEGPHPRALAPASRTLRSQFVAVSSLNGLRHKPRKVSWSSGDGKKNSTARSTPHCSAEQVFSGVIVLIKFAVLRMEISEEMVIFKKKKLLDSRWGCLVCCNICEW